MRTHRRLPSLPSLMRLRGLPSLMRLRGLPSLRVLRGLALRAALVMAPNTLLACGAAKFAGKPGFHGQSPLHASSDGLRRFSAEGFQLLFKTLTH